ncbi:hypothetical protein [Rhizobium sp. C4]|uniref:hypothetical protein n=1 Tax=Rhizobium sp. C4 TaxID=1349800 RepID=UPI001E3115D6|nr:hypothetical protein [Rhizobium sp. C4]MCD2175650.1 hypothetical protein [Rhizobium sp. C4]
MLRKIKQFLIKCWSIDSQIRVHVAIAKFFHRKVPIIGRAVSLFLDRWLLVFYGIYLYSFSINVRWLSIHVPNGVELAGHGIKSDGRVKILGGVRMTAKHPDDPVYQRLYKESATFRFGDNVVIGMGSILIGPLSICDNVLIGAGSLVNKDILEPGIYVGNPLRKISDKVDESWVKPWSEIKPPRQL